MGVKILSQATKENLQEECIRLINGLMKHISKKIKSGLRYVPLDEQSIKLVVYSDGSFASNKNRISPLGYLISMADKNDK